MSLSSSNVRFQSGEPQVDACHKSPQRPAMRLRAKPGSTSSDTCSGASSTQVSPRDASPAGTVGCLEVPRALKLFVRNVKDFVATKARFPGRQQQAEVGVRSISLKPRPMPSTLVDRAKTDPEIAGRARAALALSARDVKKAIERQVTGQCVVTFCVRADADAEQKRVQKMQIGQMLKLLPKRPKAKVLLTGGATGGRGEFYDSSFYQSQLLHVAGFGGGRFWLETRATSVEEQAWFAARLLDAKAQREAADVQQLIVFGPPDRLDYAARLLFSCTAHLEKLRDVELVFYPADEA